MTLDRSIITPGLTWPYWPNRPDLYIYLICLSGIFFDKIGTMFFEKRRQISTLIPIKAGTTDHAFLH